MATVLITLKITFDPNVDRNGVDHTGDSGLLRLNAPRVWMIFQRWKTSRGWSRFVHDVEIVSITDPVFTPEEEQGMTSNWELQNHGLEDRVEERRRD